MRAERRGEPRRIAAVITIGGKSFDVVRVEARIIASRQDCLQRQLEFGIRRTTMTVIIRFANADDGDAAPKRALCNRPCRQAFTSLGASEPD